LLRQSQKRPKIQVVGEPIGATDRKQLQRDRGTSISSTRQAA
jgi:hypothetical protein